MQRVVAVMVVGREDKAGPENLFFLKEGGEKNGQPADETAARCCGSPPRRKKCLCVWQAAAEDGVKLVISDCGGFTDEEPGAQSLWPVPNPPRRGGKSGVTLVAAHCVPAHWASFRRWRSCCCLRNNHISSSTLDPLSSCLSSGN